MAETKKKLYPDSKVELTPFLARDYDRLLDLLSGGSYRRFIARAINDLGLRPDDSVLDLGCGTGRNASLMLAYLGSGGKITGLDLLPEMKEQFERRFSREPRAAFHQQRIDIPFNLEQKFDLAFISFVLHGFPQEVRKIILENVVRHLKPGGRLAILDYAEFKLSDKPFIFRWVFKNFECAYALDFIGFDWKKILEGSGFQVEAEKFYFRNYLRLLKAKLRS
ncbi:MAG: methyltransferase domain-containing protein [Candidatus Aminicenantes bacterium]|nr:methyltransferase domain-containing protein [Candidatus Aminicenantes bacterium]